jgi:hypothetical protein
VRNLAEGNHIESMENSRLTRVENLEQARGMVGLPFPQADRMKEVQELYQKLSEELGDQVAEDKGMPPEELMPWLKRVMELPRVDLEREMQSLPREVREQLGMEEPLDLDDPDDEDGAQMTLA